VAVVWQANLTEAEKPNQLVNCRLVSTTANGNIGLADGTVVGGEWTNQV
jgi:hypothetical protein